MWPFKKRNLKSELLGLKKIRVNGMKFVIRKVNPLLDFPIDKVPQIFTEFQSRRKPDPNAQQTPIEAKRIQEQIYAYIEAGVVDPSLVPVGAGEKRGKENGITVEDLFRDPGMGTKLYFHILNHSLNHFRGIKGLFFSIRKRLWLFMHLRISTGLARLT